MIQSPPTLLDRLSYSEQQMLRNLKIWGEADAETLASHMDLSLSAIRASLQVLRVAGYLQVRREGIGPGRRRFVYSVAPAGDDLFHRGPGPTQMAILEELAHEDEPMLRRAVESVIERKGKSLAKEWQGRPPSRMSESVVQAFQGAGYVGDAEVCDEASFEMRLYHCPYLDAAQNMPWMCDAEMRLLREASGSEVERKTHQLRGDRYCTYRFRAGTLPTVKDDRGV